VEAVFHRQKRQVFLTSLPSAKCQAASGKRQAASGKRQAASGKRQVGIQSKFHNQGKNKFGKFRQIKI